MQVLTSDVVEPILDENRIYINQSIRDYVLQGKPYWPIILRGFKRVLRARTSDSVEDSIKLQGKLELIGELENFFKLEKSS